MNFEDMKKAINKRHGEEVAFSLKEENPTAVQYWIPTGSRWLDYIIAKGMKAGIPGGKISSIAGKSSTGKSYLAAQIAANAQKMGMKVVYFDSESALDPKFLEMSGINLDEFLYVQAKSIEFVLETVEDLMKQDMDNKKGERSKFLFIWDSLANTPTDSENEGDFDSRSDIAEAARILSKGFKKLTTPLGDHGSTFLILNQLKTYIPKNYIDSLTSDEFTTPGGLSPKYAYSLEIWLTRRIAKKAHITNEKDFVIGAEVKAKIKKSRFGTERRTCNFNILWGDEVGVQDEESWLEAIRGSDRFTAAAGHYKLKKDDGEWTNSIRGEEDFIKALKNDEEIRSVALDVMDEHIIQGFADMTVDASNFYDEEDMEEIRGDDEDGD